MKTEPATRWKAYCDKIHKSLETAFGSDQRNWPCPWRDMQSFLKECYKTGVSPKDAVATIKTAGQYLGCT